MAFSQQDAVGIGHGCSSIVLNFFVMKEQKGWIFQCKNDVQFTQNMPASAKSPH